MNGSPYASREIVHLDLPGLLEGDSDGDRLPDDWEVAYYHDLSQDGTGDWDLDLISDLNEFRFNSNPVDPFTQLTARIAEGPGQTVTLEWPEMVGRTCKVQYKESIDAPAWADAATTVVIADQLCSLTESLSEGVKRFYQVVVIE